MKDKTILIADDEEDVLEPIRFRLELEGCSVVTASNGYEAFGAAQLKAPDLIVLDVMMPGENGYRVSRRLREEEDKKGSPPVPILLLTARDLRNEPERESTLMDFSRADEVIYKPFDLEEVVAAVKRLLGERSLKPLPIPVIRADLSAA